MEVRDRLRALRDFMADTGLAAYVVPSSDPHQSETPPEHWRARQWISGFTGSAGTVVVTEEIAGLWVDFRYYALAEKQIAGAGIELFKVGQKGVLDYPAWLAQELEKGDTVGFDGMVLSISAARSLESALDEAGIEVLATSDPFAEIWADRPPLPTTELQTFDDRFAGESRGEKLSQVRAEMAKAGAREHIISTLDDTAWLLNVRGSDIPHVPVGVCHATIGEESVSLSINPAKVPHDLATELGRDGVTIRPYEEFLEDVAALSGPVLVSPTQMSAGVLKSIPDGVHVIEQVNVPTALKAHKNATELEHIRATMIRDGVAMVRFLHWLTGAVTAEDVTEVGAADRLEEFRAEGDRFVGLSFETISAYRGHGAMPHYRTGPDTDCLLEPAGLYLVDSGGQYLDGTTDITRTVCLGEPTQEEKTDFTLVLKGHVALSRIRFPVGTTGYGIDAVARQYMWQHGIDYGHGTGHGVGFSLMVHEWPLGAFRASNRQPLEPGMLVSNEPGIYRPGLHGVRTENLIVVRESERTDFGEFLEFETVTLCPYDSSLIDVGMLTAEEIDWIDSYHRLVRDKLLGHLDDKTAAWLEEQCRPLA